jgi:peptidoglycan-N-acetylglucosamine deacetylase
MKKILLAFALLLSSNAFTQTATTWNGKSCAVVLTYDDAIDIDLDHVVPALDSQKLKGTFYLIGSSGMVNTRMAEWRTAAKKGHELANHTLFHPCAGGPGRGFVTPETDLNGYTIRKVTSEMRMTNTFLKAIDGKEQRTFAYPCGDTKIGDTAYINGMKAEFVAARGTQAGLQKINEVDLYNVRCYTINGQNAAYMIDLVKQAMETHTLLVFLFHGVGGGHSLNVDGAAHSQLLHYLKQNEKGIWVAPMLEVAQFIKQKQSLATR